MSRVTQRRHRHDHRCSSDNDGRDSQGERVAQGRGEGACRLAPGPDTFESMIVFGILIALAGIGLFVAALSMTIRANTDSPIPLWRSPAITPPGSITMRAIGSGLIIIGAAALSTSGWWWMALVVIAGPIIALVVIPVHNSRVARVVR